MKLYHWDFYFFRGGKIEGFLICEPEFIKELDGQSFYLGECLGKHSEVEITFSEKNFRLVTDDMEFIKKFQSFQLQDVGYNLLNYYEEEE